MDTLSVAVVNYNTRDHLRVCLDSIVSEEPREVLVVDNASTDGSFEMATREYPQVTLFANTTNPGYGAAANQAVRQCHAQYVLLLNSDTRLRPGAVSALSAHLDVNPRAAIVGPRLVGLDGVLQPSCFPFPAPFNLFLEESNIGPLIRHIPVLRDRYLRTWSHAHCRVVPWVVGGAIAIRREAFDQVGGFDEAFFMYSEDVDLCYRLHAAGWQVHFTPAATIVHVGGASTAALWADMYVQYYASKLIFYRRHYSGLRLTGSIAVIKAAMCAKLVRDTIRLSLIRQTNRRMRLSEEVRVWRRVLEG